MPYVLIDALRGPTGYLDQFTTPAGVADTTKDTVLGAILVRAESYVNGAIGTPVSLVAAVIGTRVVYGNGLQTLPLPPFTAGTVTLVAVPTGHTVPDYIEQDGALALTDSTGIIVSPYRSGLSYVYGSSTVWTPGLPYTVSATFGWSAGDLAVLAEATLQTAVQLWRYRESGGSETIGAEGAITTVRAGWTPLAKEGLERIRRRLSGSVGVF